MDSSQDKERILKELDDLVFKQHANLSCNFICKQFQIHISQAIKLLEEFVKKHKNDKLSILYLLSGNDDSDDGDVKLQRFCIVDENDLESSKKQFSNPTYHVYSVNRLENGQDSVRELALNFEQFILEPSTDDLNKIQSLTYIHNPQIKTRPSRRQYDLKQLKQTVQSPLLKQDVFSPKVEIKKQETKSVPMNVDKAPIKKASPPKKRQNSKEDETNKRYKRVRVLDSSDDEEDCKMKENVKTETKTDDGFTVTKLEKELDEKPPKSVPMEKKNVKPQPKPKPQQNVLKFKTQTQTSITSFFKKPPTKK